MDERAPAPDDCASIAGTLDSSVRANTTGIYGDKAALAIVSTLASVLALIGYLFWSSLDSTHRSALVTTNNLAQILEINVETILDRARSDLSVFASQVTAADLAGPVSQARKAEFETLMASHLQSFPSVLGYHVFDAQGQSVFGAGPANWRPSFNVADRPWFQQLRDNPSRDLAISEVTASRSALTQAIILGIAIRDSGGHFIGAVNAVFDLSYFQKMIDRLDVGAHGLVTIRRSDDYRMILRRPHMDEALNGVLEGSGLSRDILSGQNAGSGDHVFQLDHTKRSYAFRTLPDYPLTVIVALSTSDYQASWRTEATLGGITAIVLAIVLIVLYWRQQNTAAQLGHLANALLVSEARFRGAFETSALGMTLVTTDGHFQQVNNAFCHIVGYSEGELLTQNIISITHPDDRPEHRVVLQKLLSGNIAAYVSEKRYIHKQGHVVWARRWASLVHAADGTLVALLGQIQDITATKAEQIEAARLASIVESSSDAIISEDCNGIITSWNAAASILFGYSADEAIGQTVAILLPPDHRQEETELLAAVIRGETVSQREAVRVTKYGKRLDVAVTVSAIRDQQGILTGTSKIIRDISQNKAIVERLQTLLETASDGIHILDTDGNVVQFSHSFARMLGYSLEETAGLNVADWDAQIPPVRMKSTIQDLINQPTAFTTKHRRKDGSIYDAEINAKGITLDGQIYLYASVRDISERTRAEAQLRDSEERFRTLVEGTTDWVWETDSEIRFSWISASFERITGLSSSLFLGRQCYDLASHAKAMDAALWAAHGEDLGAHRIFRDFRCWIQSADGRAKWISLSGTPRFSDDGTFIGYRGSGSDITAEAESAQRLKMLSTVVEQSPVSVVITNLAGSIEYVNSHLTTVSGYEATDVIGKNPRIFAAGDTPLETYRDMWATILAGKRWVGELHNRRKDGELYWEMAAIAPVQNDDGQFTRYVAFKEDISERRHLQDKLRQINAELEQFAYVASHDLRQPLRMVSSYLSIVQDRIQSKLDDETTEFMEFAVDGAKRMDRLIIDLLEYSRTGRNHEREPVPLADAVNDALTNLMVEIETTDAEIAVGKDFPTVPANRTDLVRLFQNLINNAIKYRAPERRPKVEIASRRQGQDWLISVTDNGIGIAPEDRDRAFAIFQRLVRRDQYEGTGIGLAVCKKIVEQHGGRIWIESAPNEGSTFFFTLGGRIEPTDSADKDGSD